MVEHGADHGIFVDGVNCVGGGLAGEGEQYDEHEDEVLHFNLININSSST